ncbi:hypothetical protein F443_02794 [Phytophthora nicotianae P1569]|uniref:Uncharacterized protein n=2 Tax=Phytophthora nicotianae TaxID=4792 RepID=V9FTI7_PHYNI|nr:hypothetical protein F443_02794 [Phytophthora nicotianae P1569]
MPFFVDVHPDIDWKNRCFKEYVSDEASTTNILTPGGKRSPANGYGLHVAVNCESSSTIDRDSCRAAVTETRVEGEVESVERTSEDVGALSRPEKKNARAETMFTIGVIDSEGVETKEEATEIPMVEIERDVRRNDDNVGSGKAKRFLHTDWETFQDTQRIPFSSSTRIL